MTEDSTGASRRPLYIAVGAIAVLVIVALIVVFTRPGPITLDESTPEGIVQRYAQAVMDGDNAAAREFLAAEFRDGCDATFGWVSGETRVTLRETTERGDTATVAVTVTETGGGVFGGGEYSSDERFALERDGGTWYITGTPWQFTICEETGR